MTNRSFGFSSPCRTMSRRFAVSRLRCRQTVRGSRWWPSTRRQESASSTCARSTASQHKPSGGPTGRSIRSGRPMAARWDFSPTADSRPWTWPPARCRISAPSRIRPDPESGPTTRSCSRGAPDRFSAFRLQAEPPSLRHRSTPRWRSGNRWRDFSTTAGDLSLAPPPSGRRRFGLDRRANYLGNRCRRLPLGVYFTPPG